MAATIPTRICILSDTHAFKYRRPLPESDVLLHCGDLSNIGWIDEYGCALDLLRQSNAKLKLVIAGNHDRSLDGEYWNAHRDGSDEDEENESSSTHDKAVKIWKDAAEHGIIYLNEGLYSFSLDNGVKFNIYVSPYTPEFCNWAFAYKRDQDRFNPAETLPAGVQSIAQNPIPDFPGADIVMTHGPALHHLDRTIRGSDVGCAHLQRAIERVKPRLHCFGHIHEANGAEVMHWPQGSAGTSRVEPIQVDRQQAAKDFCTRLDVSSMSANPVIFGQSTLVVNAAQMEMRNMKLIPPWVVDIDLPLATKSSVDTEIAVQA